MDLMPIRNKFAGGYRSILSASAVIAALAAVILFVLSIRGQYLLLRNRDSGAVLFCAEAADGESFSVSFTHSVNKSPVFEYYRIQGDTIYLTQLRYRAFGAGMPTLPEEGQTLSYENGDMVISGFERPMPELCYFIGRVAGHELNWRGSSVPLNELDEPGQPVMFSAVEYPRILILLRIYPKYGQTGA